MPHGPGQLGALDTERPSSSTLPELSAGSSNELIAATPVRMLPVLVIVPVVVAAMRFVRPHYLETQTTSIGFAVLCAGVLGLPALFWALDHGRTRLAHLAGLGALGGLLAPLAVLVTGALGQLRYGGGAYLRRVFDHGATLPWYGTLPWPHFAGLAAASAIAGAVSGVVYWLLFVHRRPSLVVSLALSAVAIAAGAGVAMLLP